MRFNNPTRRNRNSGTSARGHGRDNSLTIPNPRARDRRWYENAATLTEQSRPVHGIQRRIFIEAPRSDWEHACSVNDVCTVLERFPPDDIAGLQAILFRCPTRKQVLLQPSWGRMTFLAELGVIGQDSIFEGSLLTLDAQIPGTKMRWSRKLDLAGQQELSRLRDDGHEVIGDSRGWFICSGRDAIRNTQLHRTVPHEVGHWIDYTARVERSDIEESSWTERWERYWARPQVEREAFAHAYAEAFTRASNLLVTERETTRPVH